MPAPSKRSARHTRSTQRKHTPRRKSPTRGGEPCSGRPRRLGRLLAIGGAEERSASGEILQHLVQLAGGAGNARILICAGALDDGRETLKEYQRVFQRLGAETATEPLRERPDGNNEALVAQLDRATAVFFTGGDQLQLTATMAGTHFGESIRSCLQTRGLVVAGTSAGAAAMSSTMIVGGPNDGLVRRSDVDLAPGLGYWREALIDTHFSQRGRVNRLLTLLAENPQILGIGLDENTAVSATPGRGFCVLGSGTVTIFDGRVQFTNAAEVASDEPLALFGARLHVLPRGYAFDLVTRTPQHPAHARRTRRAG